MKKVLFLIILSIVSPLVVFAIVNQNTQTTQWEVATTPDAATQCSNAESLNETGDLQNGTTGYYLYCIKISCTNGVNVHTIDHPLSSALTCRNGNTNPHSIINSSGAPQGGELANGAACSEDGVYAYATEKRYYDCSLVSGGEPYTTTTTTTTTTKAPTTTTTTTTTTRRSTTTRDPKEEPTTTRDPKEEPTTTRDPKEEPTTTRDSKEEETTTAIVVNPTTTTMGETTTVKSPDTGVEDYFLALGGTIAVLVTGLYMIDKKNIFKKI